jgi:hypothetical protein
MSAPLIQPGDKVFMAIPSEHIFRLDSDPVDFAGQLDREYDGVEFEIFATDDNVARGVLFVYRAPGALERWVREQEVRGASESVIGLTPDHQ